MYLRGLGHQGKEDYLAAIAAYRDVLDLDRSLAAESRDVASDLNDLANVEAALGDLEGAERDYREALRVARTLGYVEGEAAYTGNLAELMLGREDWSKAEVLAREALPLSEKVGRLELIGLDCHRLAQALLRQEKRHEGLPYALRAVEILTQLGHASEIEKARKTLEECRV